MNEFKKFVPGEEPSIIYNAMISIGIGIIVAAGLIGIAKISTNLKKNRITKKK